VTIVTDPQHTEIVAEGEAHDRSRVTVAISLYNYRDYITTCLQSVHDQTLQHLDLVVVDDGSHDDGHHEVQRWLAANRHRFGRYSLLKHRTNRRLAAARNTAFARARTELVFVLDADNLLYPRCLQELCAALDVSGASFAYSYLEKFGDGSGLHNLTPWNPSGFKNGNTIDAMVLLRRDVWKTVGGYSIDMPVMGWEDFDLWFKIARVNGWGVQVPEILGRYRVHHDSMIWTVTNPRADELWRHLRSRYPEAFASPEV
jgi:glycosyltransferase involved in cell wall biosynthesis